MLSLLCFQGVTLLLHAQHWTRSVGAVLCVTNAARTEPAQFCACKKGCDALNRMHAGQIYRAIQYLLGVTLIKSAVFCLRFQNSMQLGALHGF